MRVVYYPFLLIGILLVSRCQPEPTTSQQDDSEDSLTGTSAEVKSKEDTRAKERDKTMLVLNHIKDKSKPDYEKFMDEVFFDIVLKTDDPVLKEQYQKTRWLSPAEQNEDNTWTYAFFMDPLVEDGSYELLDLFKRKYSEEESEKLVQQYESYMASPLEAHLLIQSEH